MATFVLSDESVNKYGFRLLSSGVRLERFRKNPVMLFAHEYSSLPIGRWENARVEGDRVLAEAKFDEGDPFAAEVKRKVEAGIIRCCSVGFEPLRTDDGEGLRLPGQTGPTVTEWELKECSICALGANRNAMALSESGGSMVRPGAMLTLTIGGAEEEGECSVGNQFLSTPKKKGENMTEEEKKKEQQLERELQEQRAVAEQMATERDALAQENERLKQELRALRESETERLLSEAVGDGRIGERDRGRWKELMEASPESAKAALGSLNRRARLSELMGSGRRKDEFSGKSWDELDKTGKLKGLKERDPEGFGALYRETFGKEYK